jgi:hypothetical protein
MADAFRPTVLRFFGVSPRPLLIVREPSERTGGPANGMAGAVVDMIEKLR